MKKLLTGVLMLLAAGAAFAGKGTKANGISYFTGESFYENFGAIPVMEWQSTAGFDKAIFMQEGKEYTAYFTKDGEFVGTTHDVAFSDLPQSAQKTIAKKYGEAAVEKAFYFDDNESSDAAFLIQDNIGVENADSYFVIVKKTSGQLILQVTVDGNVSFFKEVK